MTSLPNTKQHRLSNLDHGQRPRTLGVVIHVMDGDTISGAISWWSRRGNKVGAHVCVNNDVAIQTVDLDHVAYHSPGANFAWIGIEHTGRWWHTSQWVRRRRQRVLSANRTAWILYHYKCGPPKWGGNIRRHSSFPTSHKLCPGPGFPVPLYMAAVNRAYRNLVKSKGRTWNKT